MDDEVSFLRAIQRLLESRGFRVDAYESGLAFLETLSLVTPACVLLDLYMPGLTGWEVQAMMAASGLSIPVILITGDNDPDICRRARASHAAALLHKPFDERQLLSAIAAALGCVC